MSIESPGKTAARLVAANTYADASRLAKTLANAEHGVFIVHSATGSGKTQTMAWLLSEELIRPEVRSRLQNASESLRNAATRSERRVAVREFLEALTAVVLLLARFFAGIVLLILSCSISRVDVDAKALWQPPPMDETPQIAPRGPNSAVPVSTYRGGHHRSAPGSAATAA